MVPNVLFTLHMAFWATILPCRHRINVCIGLAAFYTVCGENQKLVCMHTGLRF